MKRAVNPALLAQPVKLAWAASSFAVSTSRNAVSRFAPRVWSALSKVANVTGRGGDRDGVAGARYFRAVADDYEAIAVHAGLVRERGELFRGKNVLEIGPGNSRSIALIAKSRGARSYAGVDGFDMQANDAAYLRSLYEPILRDEENEVADPETRIRALLEDANIYVGLEALERSGRKFDLVISRAALEHVADLEALHVVLRRITTPDAALLHKVDLRCHDHRWNGELDFLMFPNRVYKLMSSHVGDMPNRVRYPEYLELAAEYGFATLYAGSTHRVSDSDVATARPALTEPFRSMPSDVLAVLGVWLVEVGARHPLFERARSQAHGSLSAAPSELLSRY